MADPLESVFATVQPSDLDLSKAGIARAYNHFQEFSRTFEGAHPRTGATIVGGRTPYLMTTSSAKLRHNASAPETRGMSQIVQYSAPANEANAAIRINNIVRGMRGQERIPMVNSCACSTPGCRAACLSGSGQLGFPAQQHALRVRTAFAAAHPDSFLTVLHANLLKFQGQAREAGVAPVVRLNGTTDVRYDTLPTADLLFREHGRDKIQFNEYTKHNTRGALSDADLAGEAARFARTPNLYEIPSMNEFTTPDRVSQWRSAGRNFAVPVDISERHRVFGGQQEAMPAGLQFHFGGVGHDVVSGYRHDMRFLDPQGGHAVVLPVRRLTTGEDQVTSGEDSFVRPISSLTHYGEALDPKDLLKKSK
jgi:hypothetical protein